ncbi:MAG: 4-demethylwyosine synthase TYW1 [Candidatus Nanoarchaeia archaeon]|nr:4-demethylwyosine synthase TYW1 [Candidatus Nanoarchaeia archaeon]MDD5239454.1 4-demethylwyosine synthase TYW1 [Candidatus Nanoarchaeia archaeon]
MAKAKVGESEKKLLVKQQYGLAGEHSAVKLCTWMKKSLRDEGVCYKEKFYGIHSHRCLQCTPIVGWCTHNCKFCWRIGDFKLPTKDLEWDDPKEIVDKMIEKQRKLMNGFPGNPKANQTKVKEAQEPKHAAISLAGEPMAYPKMNALLEEFHRRGMTTFIVTNGTYPEAVKKLKTLPTQFYMTLAAPDEKTYLETCRPMIKNSWKKILKTLALFPKLNTRKVIRLTLVKGLNMHSPEKYAELIKMSGAHLIEVKGYVAVGFSRQRLPFESMPYHEEIKQFSEELGKFLKMPIVNEKEDSRVVLISDLPKDEIKLKF